MRCRIITRNLVHTVILIIILLALAILCNSSV